MEPVTTAALIGGAASLLGGALSNRASRSSADAANAMQREFAQQGIRWRVADAKAAGIHPLFALGASVSQPSPAVVGGSPVGDWLQGGGQDLIRSIMATRSQSEQAQAKEHAAAQMAYQEKLERRADQLRAERRADLALASNLANDEMQRQVLASQLARLNQSRSPGMPETVSDSRGTRDTGAVKLKPAEQPARNPYVSSQEAGSQPMWQQRETAPGVFRSFPHPDTNLDSEIVHAILAAQAYTDKWVSDTFFGGAPRYRQVRKRYDPPPGSYDMDRGYQRYGVARKGR